MTDLRKLMDDEWPDDEQSRRFLEATLGPPQGERGVSGEHRAILAILGGLFSQAVRLADEDPADFQDQREKLVDTAVRRTLRVKAGVSPSDTSDRRVVPGSPRWKDFTEALGEELGPPENSACNSRRTRPLATAVLHRMGLSSPAIAASLVFYDEHGGHCDCEILLNVERDAA